MAITAKFVLALENDSAIIPMKIWSLARTVITANKKARTARPTRPLITFCMTSPFVNSTHNFPVFEPHPSVFKYNGFVSLIASSFPQSLLYGEVNVLFYQDITDTSWPFVDNFFILINYK
jgi:hypothetical protein